MTTKSWGKLSQSSIGQPERKGLGSERNEEVVKIRGEKRE